MSEVILDASALLALINQEKGSDKVENVLADSIMSTVNLSEAITILTKINFPAAEAKEMLSNLINKIVDFDLQQAHIAAEIYVKTKKYGLSLGDRACLSLGIHKQLPIITADKAWSKLALGVKINLIR